MTVVADANLLAALVVPTECSAAAEARVAAWIDEGSEVYSPALWWYEAASAVRKHVRAREIAEDEAAALVRTLTALPIHTVPPDPDLLAAATDWAARLDQPVIYDASYLALADRLQTDLWTADRRLARRAREAGAENVHVVM